MGDRLHSILRSLKLDPLEMIAFIDKTELWLKLVIALASLAGTSGLAAWIVSALKRSFAQNTREIIAEATTAGIQAAIKRNLEARYEEEDPAKTLTLDVHFPNGYVLLVPLFQGAALVAENLVMRVAMQNKEFTALDLKAIGFGHLPPHFHATTCETIEIRTGSMTHLETGNIYRPGQTAVFAPGEMHSATFEPGTWCIVTHRPSLPSAKDRPANLSAMPDVFPPHNH